MGGYAWRKQGSIISIIKQMIKDESIRKRLLGKSRLQLENCVKKDIKTVGLGIRQREAAEDRDK